MQEDLAQNQAPQSTMPIGTPRGLYATAIFSIATCGIYDVFWAFSHFKRLSIPGKGWPGQALYSAFIPISMFKLLKTFERHASEAGHAANFFAIICAALYLISTIMSVIADAEPLVELGFVYIKAIILVFVQHKINRLNIAIAPNNALPPYGFAQKFLLGLLTLWACIFLIGRTSAQFHWVDQLETKINHHAQPPKRW